MCFFLLFEVYFFLVLVDCCCFLEGELLILKFLGFINWGDGFEGI